MEHPINALGHMLRQSAKPARETWTQFLTRRQISDAAYRAMTDAQQRAITEEWLGHLLPLPPININSLDPNDARGVDDVIDLDRERAIRDQQFYETPSGEER